ncbi:hypothetical protein [Romboutsia sp.]|uniref:hypothetical protein n=1 Tax=Romboutsia sp. TaxID=1965302 RepID=UPI002BF85AC5|nr:hypothetical protein [Romboutsia sp.]HSQ88331.1 hypothetical protein [Romboutsia sp.]
MIFNESAIKELFTPDWEDFQELMGNYFLEQLNETNVEILATLTTLIDTTLTGNNMYKVYVGDTLKVSSERYFSLVNTYNILRYGSIKTYTAPEMEG